MSKFQQWQKERSEFGKAKAWFANKDKIDSQDSMLYRIVVNANQDLFKFCGQAYSGANNYHSFPPSFLPYLTDQLKRNAKVIIQNALDDWEVVEKKMCLDSKEELVEMLRQAEEASRGVL